MNWFTQILFLIVTHLYFIIANESSFDYVTCGSVIKLANQQTDVRLHSHSIKYG